MKNKTIFAKRYKGRGGPVEPATVAKVEGSGYWWSHEARGEEEEESKLINLKR